MLTAVLPALDPTDPDTLSWLISVLFPGFLYLFYSGDSILLKHIPYVASQSFYIVLREWMEMHWLRTFDKVDQLVFLFCYKW